MHGNLNRQNSATPPLPPKNAKITPPPTPLRGITSITPLAVPDIPAPPRPDFAIIEEVSSDDISKSKGNKKSNKAFKGACSIKESKENSFFISENDNLLETFLFFFWWFLFILSRVLSIVLFFEFYPTFLLAILGLHYIFIISYLFYYAKYNDLTSFFINLWLGFVFMFSIIEYRIKFKYFDKWLVFYYILVILQNIFMTLTWYRDGIWDGSWYFYSFYIIFISISLCLLSSITYYIFLRPKKQRVYIT